MKINILKTKKGSMIMEALPSLAMALFVMIGMVGWFTYMTPRQNIEKQVHILAQKMKIQGGLTTSATQSVNSDVELFLNVLENMGYDKSKVTISCKTTPSNYNCLGVSPINSNGTNYIKRQDLEMMILKVEVPTKPALLKMSQAFFGTAGGLPEMYIIGESVLSERW